MNKTTENFFKALERYTPPVTEPVIWKLCYDNDTGIVTELTTEDTEYPYIEISREEADTNPQLNPYARVINRELIYLDKKRISVDHVYNLKVYADPDGNVVTDEYNMLLLNKHGTRRWGYE